jgi:hypothetical protein
MAQMRTEERAKKQRIALGERALRQALLSHMKRQHSCAAHWSGIEPHARVDELEVSRAREFELEWHEGYAFCDLCGHDFTLHAGGPIPAPPRVLWSQDGWHYTINPDIFFDSRERCHVCKGRLVARRGLWHWDGFGPQMDGPWGGNTDRKVHYACGRKAFLESPWPGARQVNALGFAKWQDGTRIGGMILRSGVWRRQGAPLGGKATST